MDTRNPDETRRLVEAQYGRIARGAEPGCCGPTGCGPAETASARLGYSEEDRRAVPEGSDLGLGCGNPRAIASLLPGETVLDLGSGAGFDAFLAAREVGAQGRVIGVDMTPDMVRKARGNAARGDYANVEFRLGEIEHLPVGDASVDVIISNCVLNLSPDKPAVLREAFRVLKPRGRLAISDVVALRALPPAIQADVAALTGCVSGAVSVTELERMLTEAGFRDVRVQPKAESADFIRDWIPGSGIERHVSSAYVEGRKP